MTIILKFAFEFKRNKSLKLKFQKPLIISKMFEGKETFEGNALIHAK